MLNLLKIKNIALIDEIRLEFSEGLNLLTGETGSGKSIIVDSLNALTGERISSDIIKRGSGDARIEGLFSLPASDEIKSLFDESGIEIEEGDEIEVIVRRELSLSGKNRIFVNNQSVTQAFLRKIGTLLVDIHGQGEQAALFSPSNHLAILDGFGEYGAEKEKTAAAYSKWRSAKEELASIREDEAQKLQLLDVLQFQVEEISRAAIIPGEDGLLEDEKRKLNNIEKLSMLSGEGYELLYENEQAVVTNLEKAARRIDELSGFEPSFLAYKEGIDSARAVVEDISIALRDFRNKLEFSPERLAEIEERLLEISRLKRKYGGSAESILARLKESEDRLARIEDASANQEKIEKELLALKEKYLEAAGALHEKRARAKSRFEKEIEANLKDVAMERASFEIRIGADASDEGSFSARGYDSVEFYFSANPGEPVKPIAKVASGGELSRLMLILNVATNSGNTQKTMVFDEIDTGIGGRVAESVGQKLKKLSRSQQVLCVTHQPQVASLADHHYYISKHSSDDSTRIEVSLLDEKERIEEIARMLAGEKITDSARRHAREMIDGR